MLLEELLPALRNLNRADKLRATQFLILELAKEEGALLMPDMQYPVWTPLDAYDAAETLLNEAYRTPADYTATHGCVAPGPPLP